VSPASGFHFQLYAPAVGPAVKWRLLSGNNRDMGRGVLTYRGAAACSAGIVEILRRLDELDPIFVPDGHTRSFGEMTASEKHGLPADGSLALSHRARAFQLLARARL